MYIGIQQNSLYFFTKMKNANIDFDKLFITQKYKQIKLENTCFFQTFIILLYL